LFPKTRMDWNGQLPRSPELPSYQRQRTEDTSGLPNFRKKQLSYLIMRSLLKKAWLALLLLREWVPAFPVSSAAR